MPCVALVVRAQGDRLQAERKQRRIITSCPWARVRPSPLPTARGLSRTLVVVVRAHLQAQRLPVLLAALPQAAMPGQKGTGVMSLSPFARALSPAHAPSNFPPSPCPTTHPPRPRLEEERQAGGREDREADGDPAGDGDLLDGKDWRKGEGRRGWGGGSAGSRLAARARKPARRLQGRREQEQEGRRGRGAQYPTSQSRWRTPLSEWSVNGSAAVNLSDVLTHWGSSVGGQAGRGHAKEVRWSVAGARERRGAALARGQGRETHGGRARRGGQSRSPDRRGGRGRR